MKAFNKIFIPLVVVTIIFSCGSVENQNEEEASIEVSTENLAVVDYAVEGMVCAMGCAATIEKEIVGMAGVVVSDVDYEAGKAHFEFDESVISEKEIVAKIESIADGQYKIGEWVEKVKIEGELELEEGGETEGTDESITEVSLPSFEIPNLFTLLMDQI